MRRQGPLTIRHMVVAALVMLVVNAQLTWWIIYALRENRTRLRLERGKLEAACVAEVERVRSAMAEARLALLTDVAGEPAAGRVAPPKPFVSWQMLGAATPCNAGWTLNGSRLTLAAAVPGGCVEAVAEPGWHNALLQVPPPLELARGAGSEKAVGKPAPTAALPAPFADVTVRPQAKIWTEILSGYRGRVVMMVSEGSFFAVLLLVMIGLLWRTLRREVELEHQHRNFLSAITHELKSPLASMRLALETVLRGRADSTASMRFLENALQDTERLQSLVQKVLEVTRYGQGYSAFRLRRANLSGVVEDAVATFSRRASAIGARIDVNVTPEVWIDGDEEALTIVISNLLENAIKYGGTVPEVGISLAVDGGHATLEVRDNGKGIPHEEIPLIFNRFYRCGDEMTRTTQGTGLGLYLVQQIVGAHHGAVGVSATGATGTTFRVTLPKAEVLEEGR